MMLQRIRQFFRAVTARVNTRDDAFVRAHLPAAAQSLFYAMHRVDQCHAIRVAYTAAQLATRERAALDRALLLRAALLHDVGRRKGDLDLFGKVVAVLLTHFFPRRSRAWAAAGCRLLFVYYEHSAIGARLLERIGMIQEAALVRRHHAAPAATDSRELRLLRAADEAN